MKHSTERALAALASPEEQILVRNVILTHRGRVVGLVSVQGASAENLDQAADVVEGLAPLAGEMIEESQSKRSVEGRLRRAELLYSVASAAAGANTPNSLAARIVKELSELWDLEHISVCWVEGEEAILASVHGQSIRPLEAMSFAAGPGTRGWLETGAPEVVAFDIADDVRCRRAEMSKQRIQSLALEPIGAGEQILGYIAAISSRSGAIDVPIVESLRMVAAEMFQGLLQLEGRAEAPHGLMLPGEFHRRAAASKSGCLVYLEPLRREDTVARYGAPALEIALHQLGHRLRARLPKGGALCRRPEGDFVAHLPDLSELSARNWANEAAATASMIGLPVDENGKRVPLAIRAKVAELDAPEPEAAEAEAA